MSDTRVKKFDKLLGEQVVSCTTCLPPLLQLTPFGVVAVIRELLCSTLGLIWGHSCNAAWGSPGVA